MRVAVPLKSEEILVSTQVPIVEEVFIGSVPTWYFAPYHDLDAAGGEFGLAVTMTSIQDNDNREGDQADC